MSALLVRVAVIAVGSGALWAGAVAPAGAWPIPITPQQQNFINRAHATGFPGDDDQVLQAGLQACHLLYTGTHAPDAANTLAGTYNADPGQAAAVVRTARSILCTQAPG